MGMAASAYPELPSFSDGENISVEPSIFKNMVRGTLFAVAQSKDNSVIKAIATDKKTVGESKAVTLSASVEVKSDAIDV